MSSLSQDLDKLEKELNQAKTNIADWAKDIGLAREVVVASKDVWEQIENYPNVPQQVTTSGSMSVQNLLQTSNDLITEVNASRLANLAKDTLSYANTFGTVAMSGATISIPPQHIPESYKKLNTLLDQPKTRSEIQTYLLSIDKSLAEEHQNAWDQLYTSVNDPTRSPMFMMREVYTRLLHHLAPNSICPISKGFTSPTRRDRIQYIATQIKDPLKRNAFISQEQALVDIYQLLNDAHTHGPVDVEKTKAYLYQSDALFKLIIDSLK